MIDPIEKDELLETLTLEDIITFLQDNKSSLHGNFGVTRIGIFGSFSQGRQTISSDIDMVVKFKKDKKTFIIFYN